MDHFYTFLQESHSEKSCPKWINSMNLVMKQWLDTQVTDLEEEKTQTNEPEQTNEETTMVLWDWAPTLGLSEDEPTEEIQVSSVNVMTRSKVPVVDESLLMPKINKFKENMRKVLNNTQTTPKRNPINMKETIPVVDKSMKTTINKPMETLENRTNTTKEQGMGYDIVEYIKKNKCKHLFI